VGNTGHRSKDTVREGAAPPHSEWAPPKDQLDPVRTALGTTSEILAGVVLIAVSCLGARGQSQVDATTGEFWPTVNVHIQLPDNYRLLGFVESKKGEEFAYQQLDMGLGFGYQWKAIRKPHPRNIDPDKEHTFLFGGGYEYLRTLQAGKNTPYENRLVLEGMPGSRPLSRLLVRDRNRVEFRWVNGVYSTRYRNDLSLEYDITVHVSESHLTHRPKSFTTERRTLGTRNSTPLVSNGRTNDSSCSRLIICARTAPRAKISS